MMRNGLWLIGQIIALFKISSDISLIFAGNSVQLISSKPLGMFTSCSFVLRLVSIFSSPHRSKVAFEIVFPGS
jgi:hypothetical protein